MDPNVSLITLGVPDVEQARQFYVEGLGWEPILDVPGQIVFLQVGHGLALSIFGAGELAKDVDPTLVPDEAAGAAQGPRGVALAHNVGSAAEVDAVLADAARAGATIRKPAQRAEWGGYHGYFADPAGTLWEVAHNPGWSVDPDGTVRLGPVD
ncbi:VOC family protein [Cellulomonas sp. KRMCY2]|uniref:VOC family protein n=1 Tax=Cellulomonas sp. KRMCY2 TaxID=1304865 RepID=UPI00045E9169|nr:VOC family protein [Cellulomonas sp. KRMCY2]